MIADAPAVPAVPSAPGPEVETTEGGDGHNGHDGHDGRADTTAPGPAVPAAPPPDPERDRITDGLDGVDGHDGVDGVGAAAFDSGQGEQPGLPSVQRAGRRPRFGLVAGLATIVVVVCVVAGVLVASLSGSSNSNKVPPSHQASPPPSTAPAPPPSPLKLVSNDQQGAVYNVNSSQLAVSAVANGRVWLEVIAGSGPSGQVLWQGVLSDGQTQTITNSAPVWMRIGASSNVTVSVNGGGVLLPQSPTTYNLTFSQGQV
jgi:pyruvate/2-oxoglutarate dehydrogenase complex dihydrolipoamide acyltransferase (E2) component